MEMKPRTYTCHTRFGMTFAANVTRTEILQINIKSHENLTNMNVR